jgi:hypothetical protein
MATINEVVKYISSNFDAQEDSPGLFRLLWEKAGRSQVVYVSVNDPFVVFASAFAPTNKVTASKALDINDEVFGVKQMGDYWALVHVALLDTIDPLEIDAPLVLVARAADQLESKISLADDL